MTNKRKKKVEEVSDRLNLSDTDIPEIKNEATPEKVEEKKESPKRASMEIIEDNGSSEISTKGSFQITENAASVIQRSVSLANGVSETARNKTQIDISIEYPKGYFGRKLMKEHKVMTASRETAQRLELKGIKVTYHKSN